MRHNSPDPRKRNAVTCCHLSSSAVMTGQLFPNLPLAPRPPRRLRLIGFELEVLSKLRADMVDDRRELERNDVRLAAAVAEAKAAGHVIEDAYGVVIDIVDLSERMDKNMQRIDGLQRTLEQRLAKGIERHLARASALAR